MKLNYKSFGSGPGLVILHGLFGSLDNWQTLARKYADHFSVFIIDQRNHGKSPHRDEFNYQLLSEDLGEFLDDHGIWSTSFLGHSMGGKAVMRFALDHEERVEKLIVADMSPVEYPPHHTEILEALNSFPIDKITDRGEADEWFSQRIKEEGVRQFILKSLGRDEENALRWKFNLKSLTEHYEEILAGITADHSIDTETLFIRGERSDYVKDEHREVIGELFTNYKLEILSGAGHWLHAEQPMPFLDATLKFLKD